jgi:hypothetical protein
MNNGTASGTIRTHSRRSPRPGAPFDGSRVTPSLSRYRDLSLLVHLVAVPKIQHVHRPKGDGARCSVPAVTHIRELLHRILPSQYALLHPAVCLREPANRWTKHALYWVVITCSQCTGDESMEPTVAYINADFLRTRNGLIRSSRPDTAYGTIHGKHTRLPVGSASAPRQRAHPSPGDRTA